MQKQFNQITHQLPELEAHIDFCVGECIAVRIFRTGLWIHGIAICHKATAYQYYQIAGFTYGVILSSCISFLLLLNFYCSGFLKGK